MLDAAEQSAGGHVQREQPFEKKYSNWEQLYKGIENLAPIVDAQQTLTHGVQQKISFDKTQHCFQLYSKYIAFNFNKSLILVSQQAAHERVLYESNLNALQNNKTISQQQLFPQTFELNASDFQLMKELENDLKIIGFDLNVFGTTTYVIHGTPAYVESGKELPLLESILDQFKMNAKSFRIDMQNHFAKSIARSLAIKEGQQITEKEMKHLLEELFQCNHPELAINGNKVYIVLEADDFEKMFIN